MSKQHRLRMKLRAEIHVDARLHREAAARLDELHNGAIPATPGEEDACWAVMSLALDDLRLSEQAYLAAAQIGV